MYNNNNGSEARQLLQYAQNINVLSMTENDFQTIGKGLIKTLNMELQYGSQAGDQQRVNNAQNMLNEINGLNSNNINTNMVQIMIKTLVELLTNQIQSSGGNNLFSNNNNSNGLSLNNTSGIAFGSSGLGNNSNTQANPSFNFGGNDVKETPKQNIVKTKTVVNKVLTLEEVIDTMLPSNGFEYPPLYDSDLYTLWYELDKDRFKYILVQKDK